MLACHILADSSRRDMLRLDLSRWCAAGFDWRGDGEIAGGCNRERQLRLQRPNDKGASTMTKIIITSILLALFSIPSLAQEEKPKLNANAGAARRLIIQYLIDHLDRCMAQPVATPDEIKAADRCHAILTEKMNLTP